MTVKRFPAYRDEGCFICVKCYTADYSKTIAWMLYGMPQAQVAATAHHQPLLLHCSCRTSTASLTNTSCTAGLCKDTLHKLAMQPGLVVLSSSENCMPEHSRVEHWLSNTWAGDCCVFDTSTAARHTCCDAVFTPPGLRQCLTHISSWEAASLPSTGTNR